MLALIWSSDRLPSAELVSAVLGVLCVWDLDMESEEEREG